MIVQDNGDYVLIESKQGGSYARTGTVSHTWRYYHVMDRGLERRQLTDHKALRNAAREFKN